MIKFEHTVTPSPEQWKAVIIGARNPLNSWNRSDSGYVKDCSTCKYYDEDDKSCRADDWSGQPINTDNCYKFKIGPNDLDLMKRLRNAGTDHRKFMRMIPVMVTITASLYWWKEFDTYKVGSVANSCSTMHKIATKEFTLEDFSHEHLCFDITLKSLTNKIELLNNLRDIYLNGGMLRHANGNIRTYGKKEKDIWWQMIQLLPSSYNQRRTVMLNYEVLTNMYQSRKGHKLDEWNDFCKWIQSLPYSEIITLKK